MKFKHTISALILSSCAATSASFAADTKPLLKVIPHNRIELMFFQQAHAGSIKQNKSGCYELLLSNIEPEVMYFSNSPDKKAGNLTLSQFAETMTHSQKAEKIKPNTLVNIKFDTSSINMIGTLSNALYTGKEFHYTFCPFGGNQLVKEGKIRSINLFVDPIHRWPP